MACHFDENSEELSWDVEVVHRTLVFGGELELGEERIIVLMTDDPILRNARVKIPAGQGGHANVSIWSLDRPPVSQEIADLVGAAVIETNLPLEFDSPGELCLPVPAGTDPSELAVLHFNEASRSWESTKTILVDEQSRQVCGELAHFSVYGLGKKGKIKLEAWPSFNSCGALVLVTHLQTDLDKLKFSWFWPGGLALNLNGINNLREWLLLSTYNAVAYRARLFRHKMLWFDDELDSASVLYSSKFVYGNDGVDAIIASATDQDGQLIWESDEIAVDKMDYIYKGYPVMMVLDTVLDSDDKYYFEVEFCKIDTLVGKDNVGYSECFEVATKKFTIDMLGNIGDEDCDGVFGLFDADNAAAAGSQKDGDSDGYPAEVDCNDSAWQIHPGAKEKCGNGVDEDCDGVDSSCPSPTYLDADGDGFSGEQGDCNDSAENVYPGHPEVCGNGEDDDCYGGDQSCTPADNHPIIDSLSVSPSRDLYSIADELLVTVAASDQEEDPLKYSWWCSCGEFVGPNDAPTVNYRVTAGGCCLVQAIVHSGAYLVTKEMNVCSSGPGPECEYKDKKVCYQGPPGSLLVGACHGGAAMCVDGAWSACQGQVMPTAEACDEIDSDCDGETDDGCDRDCTGCPEDHYCQSGVCVPGRCEPDCTGKECGNDGCNGSCGYCSAGSICNQQLGSCAYAGICTPQCGNQECGPDGCGGVCGSCAPGFECIDSACSSTDCQPNCGGKVCGDDGCGGHCGSCAPDPECPQEPGESSAQTCLTGTDLGVLSDDGAQIEISGNISPDGDEDWYTFNATDGPDPDDCDTFHVAVVFKENPAGQFVFDVFMEGCSWGELVCKHADQFDWYVDFSTFTEDSSAGGGECGCREDADHQLTPPEQLPSLCLKKREVLLGCPGGQKCVEGGCQVTCSPVCASKSCGPDGCGETCGECPEGQFCQDGSCLEVCLSDSGCVDASSTKCSADGLGTLACVEAGTDCFQLGPEVAPCGPNELCSQGQCIPACIPDCVGKLCGSDGCGGTCGDCPAAEYCNGGICTGTCVSDPDCQAEGTTVCNAAGTGYHECILVPGQTLPNSEDDTGPDSHQCQDNSNTYYLRVYRSEAAAYSCDNYVLEISNGLHPFSIPAE